MKQVIYASHYSEWPTIMPFLFELFNNFHDMEANTMFKTKNN